MTDQSSGAPFGGSLPVDTRHSVAIEMEAILAALPRQEPAPPSPATPSPGIAVRSAKRRNWIIALLAVAIIPGGVIGLTMPRIRQQDSQAPNVQRKQAPEIVEAAPLMPQADTAPAFAHTAAAAPAVTSAPAKAQGQSAGSTLREPVAQGEIRRSDECGGDAGSSAWCLRGAALDADNRLRDAYADAVRAGVDRDMLVGVRNDWARLRRRSNDDPQSMIRGFATLTEDLRASTNEARSQ